MIETLNLLPTVPTSTSAYLPAEARYVAHYENRLRSRSGIRPVSLFVFEVLGESGFLVADGDTSPHLACGRCGGYGEYSFNQMDGTMCYGCNGDGLGKPIEWTDAIRIAKRRIASAKRAARVAELARLTQAHAWNDWRDENADVIGWLAGKDERRGFVGDMARKTAVLETLTDRQADAIRKIAGEDSAKTEKVVAAGHFGEIGKRAKGIKATVRKIVTMPDNGFGISYLIIMETPEGHALKTFTSGAFADVEEGQEIVFAATPKAHGEYAGKPETMLSRCALAK
jgi:hypothetical protein